MRRSERGLDWFTFFVADIQTGFGPFLAVYLTTQKWNQADIGLILAIGSLAGLLSQLPAGWLVDMAPSKRRVAMLAVVGIGISALLIALFPSFLGILIAKLLHVASSSVLGPAIAAITLGLVGHAAVGPRLGRNARFASIGNGLAAGVMGATGYLISPQAVFLVTAVLALPTLLALAQIRESDIDSLLADGGLVAREPRTGLAPVLIGQLLRKRSLLVLTFALFLFHAANAAMLPLVGTEMAMRSDRFVLPILGLEINMGQWASALVAVCIVVPQLMVALIAPGVGRLAVHWGRRPVLLLGFAALPARAAVLAFNSDPWVIVAAQMLDGICGAVLGVLVPLSLADITRGSGRFNLAQGIAASATGVGAALSAAVAGYLATRFGSGTAFLGLAVTAAAAFITLLVAMPETAPTDIDGLEANRTNSRTL
ncbi:MAG TPA: MFS transporter [Hyphomicrobiaceae bacterium]|nr:MFS transporter [Hyphomicrobiaceae bacterium]